MPILSKLQIPITIMSMTTHRATRPKASFVEEGHPSEARWRRTLKARMKGRRGRTNSLRTMMDDSESAQAAEEAAAARQLVEEEVVAQAGVGPDHVQRRGGRGVGQMPRRKKAAALAAVSQLADAFGVVVMAVGHEEQVRSADVVVDHRFGALCPGVDRDVRIPCDQRSGGMASALSGRTLRLVHSELAAVRCARAPRPDFC